MRRLLCLGFALSMLFVVARPSVADESAFGGVSAPATPVIIGAPESYGTGSLSVFIIPSVNFTPRSSTTAFVMLGGIERFITTGGAALDASPMLPNGSQVERIELRACDTSATTQVSLFFGTCPTNGDACTGVGSVSTGAAETPGCSDFSTTLAVPLVIDNQTAPTIAEITTGTTFTTTFSAVKIYYRLRVSPAPAVATFPNDVPTSHPFFRFIEALAAAGITAGCAPSAFCPNQPVTRGEMAVFLAAALGLHFPN